MIKETAVAAIVLAAGRSRRMAGTNKLLQGCRGKPLVTWAVTAALSSNAHPVIVVLGHQAPMVRAALPAGPAVVIENPCFAEGMSTSLRIALAAVPAAVPACVVLLADMPDVTASHVNTLIAAYVADPNADAWVPTWRGRRGNPVLLTRRLFADVTAVGGDKGARAVFDRPDFVVRRVEMSDDAILRDVDTPEDLAAVR